MTPRERAENLWGSLHGGAGHDLRYEDIVLRIEMAICRAISAAINEDRKMQPHTFAGRTDRGCELCGEPDRDTIHCYSREHSRRFVSLAIEAEREACAQVLDWLIDELSGVQMYADCSKGFKAGAGPAYVFNTAIGEAIELSEQAQAQIRARSESEKKGE